MKSLALSLLLALVGCAGQDDHDGVPVEPGGGQTPTGVSTETLIGRICISDTLLDLTRCRVTDLAGFTVTIGGNAAITDNTGTFVVETPTGSLLAFTTTGPGIVTTTTPFSPVLTVPVIDAEVLAQALATNNVLLTANQGSILGTVIRNNGVAANNVVVVSTPVSAFSPLFDEGTDFGLNATGVRGVFLVPGIATGPASLLFRDTSGAETTVAGIQVINGGVTILDSVPLP